MMKQHTRVPTEGRLANPYIHYLWFMVKLFVRTALMAYRIVRVNTEKPTHETNASTCTPNRWLSSIFCRQDVLDIPVIARRIKLGERRRIAISCATRHPPYGNLATVRCLEASGRQMRTTLSRDSFSRNRRLAVATCQSGEQS